MMSSMTKATSPVLATFRNGSVVCEGREAAQTLRLEIGQFGVGEDHDPTVELQVDLRSSVEVKRRSAARFRAWSCPSRNGLDVGLAGDRHLR